ncbi:MAG: RDD family protein [Ectothiorhodospiraceae bacterium]|nr:RDD family protein [Ectothiorhodospiraceae bacterium]
MPESPSTREARPAGFFRRLGAAAYDLMLLTAVVIAGAFAVLPLTGGEEVPARWMPLFQLYILVLAGGFFVLFWLWGNQTLGMKAWHLYLRRADGGLPRLPDALKRLAAMVITLGPVGLISMPFDPNRRSLADLLSGTVILHQPPGSDH